MKNYRLFLTALLIVSCAFIFSSLNAADEQFTFIVSGETHSALYPCNCNPHEGGVSKRMTVINDLRAKNKNVLLLDSGAIFGGGVMDPYAADASMAKKRTDIYLQAIALMQYDGIAIGEEEFGFGTGYLENAVNTYGLPLLSANIDFKPATGYIVKKVGGMDVGIFGLSPSLENIQGLNVKSTDPVEAAKNIVAELKSKNVSMIILLSHLGEDKDEELAQKVEGINLIVSAHMLARQETTKFVNKTLLIQPFFQSRRLRVLKADFSAGELKNLQTEDIPLDDKIANNPKIDALLPTCFAASECREEGFVGECLNPGEADSECVFRKITGATLTVINPKNCVTCNTQFAESLLKSLFPKLEVVNLESDSAQGAELIKKYEITDLPAYLLDKNISRSPQFQKMKQGLAEKDDHYLVLPSSIGMSYFNDRQEKPNTIDVILNVYSPEALPLLKLVKEVLDKNPGKLACNFYFLSPAMYAKDPVVVKQNQQQIEEVSRELAIIKTYPDKWWEYAYCRLENPETSWWDDCALSAGIDIAKVKEYIKTTEYADQFNANGNFLKELKNPGLSVILLNNREIFGVSPQTKSSELEDIIFGRAKKQ